MRAVGKAGHLAATAATAARAIDQKAAKGIPLLGCLLVDATDTVAFTGTDLNIQITTAAAAAVATPGRAAVPAAALVRLLGGIDTDTETTLELDGSVLAVRAGRSRYRLEALPVEDVPAALKLAAGEAKAIALDEEHVERLFGTPAFAISTEELRYYLNGIYLHVDADGHLRGVATDGHRLCLSSTKLKVIPDALPDKDGAAGIIIPRKVVGELARLKRVVLRTDGRLLKAIAGDVALVSKLIDATYPAFEKVIPKPSKNTAEIDRLALLAALERVAAIAGDAGVVISWEKGAGEIHLGVARQPDAADDVVAAATTGQGRIAIPVGQAIRVIHELAGERVKLDVTDASTPMRINLSGRDDLLVLQTPCTG